MDLLSRFREFISTHHLFQPKDRLLLAVSGGVDSVVLCGLCMEAGYDFEIAHANFQLRGEESMGDEKLVIELGEQWKRKVHVRRFDTHGYASQQKLSVQVAARTLRYDWFHQILEKSNEEEGSDCGPVRWILTAHHLDDNIETSLMHLFRGTGISGLRGMLPRQGKLIRPLLFASKDEIISYGEEHHLAWREDSSNASSKYARNFLRLEVWPLLKRLYPQAEENMAANLARFREIEFLYDQAIDRHKKLLLFKKGEEYHIPVLKLKKSAPLASIVYEISKDFGFTAQQTGEWIDLLDSPSGKYVLSPSHRVLKDRNWLIISPNQEQGASMILIEEGSTTIGSPNFFLDFSPTTKPLTFTDDPRQATLDAKEIRYPLLLRKWRAGDYFYPLGMPKKKKIARFLIDQKLPRTEKDNVWVLESDRRIIWVVGRRIDHRFRITDRSQLVLNIKMRVR